eukprot:GHVU01143132.1.p1 GENE.GHVU01143132.1~~GHVU01143132.1.p1  ORF type:complete len:447 (-),score=21.21 GHVU01143132.1:567-1907(-)
MKDASVAGVASGHTGKFLPRLPRQLLALYFIVGWLVAWDPSGGTAASVLSRSRCQPLLASHIPESSRSVPLRKGTTERRRGSVVRRLLPCALTQPPLPGPHIGEEGSTRDGTNRYDTAAPATALQYNSRAVLATTNTGGLWSKMAGKSRAGMMQEAKNEASLLRKVWHFSRPHTLVGSMTSLAGLFAFATHFQRPWMDSIEMFVGTAAASVLANIFITGLNQVTDVEIDKVNKPFLPIPSGMLSLRAAKTITAASLIGSLSLGFLQRLNSPYFPALLAASSLLGAAYSLPPIRLKRFPIMAALSIIAVRGLLVNVGFYHHFKYAQPSRYLNDIGGTVTRLYRHAGKQLLALDREVWAPAGFFLIFSSVIAIMKDVPDLKVCRIDIQIHSRNDFDHLHIELPICHPIDRNYIYIFLFNVSVCRFSLSSSINSPIWSVIFVTALFHVM